ncbi:DNA polymerase III subunit [Bdellovibrionota bacterium FG-2]
MLPITKEILTHHALTLTGPVQGWLKQGHFPPVLLFCGSRGIGKTAMATYLAQWILCHKKEKATGPCGECPACAKALRGTWIDFTCITPESSEGTQDSQSLKIDQFRKLKATQGFGAVESAYRITLIPNVERLTPQAANSILKLLEEPPPNWLLFLTTSDPSLLLPTILSRCQKITFKPLPTQTLEDLLRAKAIAPECARVCAHLSQGSWERAFELSEKEAWEKRKDIFAFLEEPRTHLNSLLEWAAKDPSHLDLLIDQQEHITSELLAWSLASPAVPTNQNLWKNSDGAKSMDLHIKNTLLKQGTISKAREFWLARAERLARARGESVLPLNRKLLIQDLLLGWFN